MVLDRSANFSPKKSISMTILKQHAVDRLIRKERDEVFQPFLSGIKRKVAWSVLPQKWISYDSPTCTTAVAAFFMRLSLCTLDCNVKKTLDVLPWRTPIYSTTWHAPRTGGGNYITLTVHSSSVTKSWPCLDSE
jgi:hypothetical protein